MRSAPTPRRVRAPLTKRSRKSLAVPDAAFSFRVHDTLAGRKVRMEPGAERGRQPVRLYVCGVTPYDSGHMGHAFTFCTFDILVRFLEASGVRVRYVQNVTDVDDPLFERARLTGVDWRVLADRETQVHIRDMTALGWRPPDFMPRVSEEVDGILKAASTLNASGYAYQTDALYFDASRYRGYGRLSHRTRRSMIRKLREEGTLGTVGPGAKQDALDFPLWRRSAPDEPAWPSRFGEGRPGWHIECSAMAMRYLGAQIDIHGGGRDLIFSHHESERAQSESLTGKVPFARAWMHTGMVRYEGRKMSKSLGNLVHVSQALQRAPAAAVRLYLASHRYGRDWDFSWSGLARAARLVERVRALLAEDARGAGERRSAVVVGAGPALRASKRPDSPLVREFTAALQDDLDTPRAIRALRRATRERDAAAARWMLGILAGSASLT
jgi:L-cysteine:1D-myo-inositol 2-amino-2-deoxy-alpha-D-glucopyranoside ligase